MKSRCTNTNNPKYFDYGARGIIVCNKWLKLSGFIEDMYSTYNKGLTLERKNNNLGYTFENCKWATYLEQNNNKRNNVFYNYKGERYTLPQISRLVGVEIETIRARLKRGRRLEDAVIK